MKSSIHKLLVVDPRQDSDLALVRCLSQFGYQVLTATTVQELLGVIPCERLPHLVLLDASLSDVLPRIRQDPSLSQVWVVLTNGHSLSSEQRAECLELGAEGFLSRDIFRSRTGGMGPKRTAAVGIDSRTRGQSGAFS